MRDAVLPLTDRVLRSVHATTPAGHEGMASSCRNLTTTRTDFRRAGLVMGRLAKLSSRWLGEAGFSFGAGDVKPAAALVATKTAAIDEHYATVAGLIQRFHDGTLELISGCDREQSLEVCCRRLPLPPPLFFGVLSWSRDIESVTPVGTPFGSLRPASSLIAACVQPKLSPFLIPA